MKKIIAAFDGLQFSQATLDYTIFIAQHSSSHIVGIFLDDLMHHSYSFAELITEEGGVSDKKMTELNDRDKETRDESVEIFEKACRKAGLNYSVHRDKNVALQELLHESIYADLLIVNNAETFTRFEEGRPSAFVRDLLSEVECAVLLVPDNYHPVDSLILLFDGGPSSVYAVKMFSYLLPGLKNLNTEVLSVKSENQSLHLPDNKLMKEFMKRHFPRAEYAVFKGDAEQQLVSYLQKRKDHFLVVLGAYRRSRVSRWFKRSMADSLIQYLNHPLFIAHNK